MAMKKKGNLVLWVIVFVAVITAAYTVYNKNKPLAKALAGPEEKQAAQVNTAALKAPGFTLKGVDGKTVKLSDYAGKIVFLNFWTTWCPYCIEEMPDLDQANKDLLQSGKAEILTIDVMEKEEEVKRFISEYKLSLPVLMDKDGKVAQAYRITGFPTTVIITPDGNISEMIVGATDRETIMKKAEQLMKQIKE